MYIWCSRQICTRWCACGVPTETVKGRLCIRGLRLRFFFSLLFRFIVPSPCPTFRARRTARVSAECNDDARVRDATITKGFWVFFLLGAHYLVTRRKGRFSLAFLHRPVVQFFMSRKLRSGRSLRLFLFIFWLNACVNAGAFFSSFLLLTQILTRLDSAVIELRRWRSQKTTTPVECLFAYTYLG